MRNGLLFEKICKYILYYLCVIILLLGYWGFVKVYYNQFPIYNYKILDYVSALGLYTFIYLKMDNLRRELLILLNIK